MPEDTLLRERLRGVMDAPSPAPRLDRVIRRARRLMGLRVAGIVLATATLATAIVVPIAMLRDLHGQGTSSTDVAGVSVLVPTGWQVRTEFSSGVRGVLIEAASDSFLNDADREGGPPRLETPGFAGAARVLYGTEVAVGIAEVTSFCPCPGFTAVEDQLGFSRQNWYQADPVGSNRTTRDFQLTGGYMATVSIAGRSFVVWARFPERAAPPELLAQANLLLGSFHVQPVRSVPDEPPPPVRFTPTEGWTTWWQGSRWPTALALRGSLPMNDVIDYGLSGIYSEPPRDALASLDPADILIVATRLQRRTDGPLLSRSIDDAVIHRDPEFQASPRFSWRRLEGRVSDRLVWIDVYLGTAHPSRELLAEAQRMLDGLEIRS